MLITVGEGNRLAPGQTIDGRYRVNRLLGEGTMGTVYLAEHALIGRRVALKLLRPELAADPEVVERFMNEARAAGTLGHDHICESTDMGFIQGVPYIVLEYLEGVVLADEIHSRPELPVRRVLRIGQQIAAALQAAHSAGIVHRDLKSDNVFLTDREGRPDHVKVLDFGISEFVDVTKKSPRRGLIAGTPEFMAPEQITSPTNVDARADVYALGVILYHMLTGQRPFVGADLPALLERIVHDPVPPITRNVPQRLIALVESMLAKRPEDRPQTMTEVEDELVGFAEAYQTGPVPRISTEIEVAPRALAPTSTSQPAARRSPRMIWIAGAAGGAVLGIVAIVVIAGGDKTKPAPQRTPAAEPAPAPAAAATEPAQPSSVELLVRTDAPDGRFTLRRRSYRAGERITVTAGDVAEVIEVSAAGRKTRRFWLTLDRSATLQANLPAGRGTIEATEGETLVALGEATAPQLGTQAPRVAAATPATATRQVTPTPTRQGSPPAETPKRPQIQTSPAPSPDTTGASANVGSGAPRVATGSGSGVPRVATGSGSGSARPAVEKPASPPETPAPATTERPPAGVAGKATIDGNAVKVTVRSHIAEIQSCYERGRMDNLDLAGRVVMRISVGTDGQVAAVAAESSTLNAPKVEGCIAKAIKGWQFPPAVGGTAVISYPFVLK